MQSLQWYVERLKTMSPSEILWRVRSLARDTFDRYRIAAKHYPSMEDANVGAWVSGFHLPSVLGDQDINVSSQGEEWARRLMIRADLLVEHKVTYFQFDKLDLGESIDWHRDYNLDIGTPITFSPLIDYRNAQKAGDCKHVWELNRHQHWVVLARAYRLSGEEKYAEELVSQWLSWLDANPFAHGMNWRSPMELGIRLINWVYALDLIKGSPALTDEVMARIQYSVYLHCWDTVRKYSQGSSANNHLIGEVAGVFAATAYFKNMPNGEHWYREAKALLMREIMAQSYESGCSKEHTFGYPYFVIQFFLSAGMIARWKGDDFGDDYWMQLEKMLEFMARLTEGGEYVPMVGDADDGYVLDLDDGRRDYRRLSAVAAILFKRSDFKAWAGDYSESAWWWLGDKGFSEYQAIDTPVAEGLKSYSFPDAGYHLLQCGEADNKISVLFDCAELGYGAIAAHGHADALSVVVRAYGHDLLVDPGTYDYYTYPDWRDYFRSTFAHNTVQIDGQDQSEMKGRFLWGKRAECQLIDWQSTDTKTQVVGEHDGYQRLSDPVTHRRSLQLDHVQRTLTITDELSCSGEHDISLQFHFGELCELSPEAEDAVYAIQLAGQQATISLDNRLQLVKLEGSEAPKGGWLSRGYHRKVTAPMLYGECRIKGADRFVTTIRF